MKCILPCAGFGTRVGMKSHEAKEMLPDHTGTGLIIDYALKICELHKFEPVVISRAEKVEFNEYIESQDIELVRIQPKGEWMTSVLASFPKWDDDNILILPDTRYNNHFNIFENIRLGLELGNDAVFGMHEVKDPEKWGIVKDCQIIDKPKLWPGPQKAWGIIGFKRAYGMQLFNKLQTANDDNPFILNNVGYVNIGSFVDITRGK